MNAPWHPFSPRSVSTLLAGASFGISFQAEEIVYTSPSKQPLSNFSSKRPIEVTDVSDEIGDEYVSAKCHRVDSGDNEV